MTSPLAALYAALADRLAAEVPALGWIDLDQGQLDPDQLDQEYALPFDRGVALLDFDEVSWRDIGQGVQRGDCQLRLTLAQRVTADSYATSTQRSAALARLDLLAACHAALHHHRDPQARFGALVRTYARKEASQLPGVWVYSMGYNVLLTDTSGYDGPASTVAGVGLRESAGFVLPG